MGQEWGAGAPFLYITDHNAQRGALVRDGRRADFGRDEAVANEAARGRIPDPQDEATFAASRLDWTELAREPHAATARLHAALLALRTDQAGMRGDHGVRVEALDRDTMAIVRESADSAWLVVARLRGSGAVDAGTLARLVGARTLTWRCHLTTEDPSYAPEPQPVVVDVSGPVPSIRFARPSAVVVAGEDAAPPGEGSRTP
jgi:maltooligosyltrehalose trehalohydrolase